MPVTPGNSAYSDKSIPESYVDNLELLELKDNKIYKLAGTVKAKGPEHFWVKDKVRTSRAASASASPEGVQFAGRRSSDPGRLYNTTQLFSEDVQVTGTDQRSEHIGFDDRFAFESEKSEKALAKDIEQAIIYGTRNQGTYTDGTSTESVYRQLGGLKFLIQRDAVTNYVANANVALDDDYFTARMQTAWTNGDVEGDLDIFTPAKQKTAIDLFTTPNQRNIEAKSKMIVLPVDTIATSFGTANLHLHRELLAADLVGVDVSVLKKASLLAPKVEKYAKRGDSMDGQALAELSLEFRRPENGFWVSGLL
ncbi:MAG: SU10 major capsid protein [Candidatus Saccharimonadaceae bacterium]